ncbi:Protein kinase-like domain [Cordyceps javanica]|nr:Protein kinase-like domain [Cordyceps javanica]
MPFDGEQAGTCEATGFVVDAERGYIVTSRHVAGPGPFWGSCIFCGNQETACSPLYIDPVDDFAFLKYDPLAVNTQGEFRLSRTSARVGQSVMVIGNDAAEEMSIIRGVISLVNRNAPEYVGPYSDFNIQYYQANMNLSGGISGSPVIGTNGKVLGVVSGSLARGAICYILPAYRIRKTLRCLWQDAKIPRGDIQCQFSMLPLHECKLLGLDHVWEAHFRRYDIDLRGLLVAKSVLPNGSSAGKILACDILVSINDHHIGDFDKLGDLFDGSVGQQVTIRVLRDSKPVVITVVVQDLYGVTPSRLLRVGGLYCHSVSYVQATKYEIPLVGVYVAQSDGATTIGDGGSGWIISVVNNETIERVDDFLNSLTGLREGEKIAIVYAHIENLHRKITCTITLDAPHGIIMFTHDPTTGAWAKSSTALKARLELERIADNDDNVRSWSSWTSSLLTLCPLAAKTFWPRAGFKINANLLGIDTAHDKSGVLLDADGSVAALWIPSVGGVAAHRILPVISSIQRRGHPAAHVFPAEMELVAPEVMMLSGAPRSALRQRQIYRVKNVLQGSDDGEESLMEGDFVLAINGKCRLGWKDFEVAGPRDISARVWRRNALNTIEFSTVDVGDLEVHRCIEFCGASIQPPHLRLYHDLGSVPSGVFLSRIAPGSPAERFQLPCDTFITGLNGEKVTTMEDFVQKVRAIPADQELTVLLTRLGGAVAKYGLRQNNKHFPLLVLSYPQVDYFVLRDLDWCHDDTGNNDEGRAHDGFNDPDYQETRAAILKQYAIGSGLDPFRTFTDGLLASPLSSLPSLSREDLQDVTRALLLALRKLPAASRLPSRNGEFVFQDLLRLTSAVSDGDFDLRRTNSLLEAALARGTPDARIWDLVNAAVEPTRARTPASQTTPPRTKASSLQTPFENNSGSNANSSERRRDMDEALKEELTQLLADVPRFQNDFLGGIEGLAEAAANVFRRCTAGERPLFADRWCGWPRDANPDGVLAWFKELLPKLDAMANDTNLSPSRRSLLASPNQAIQGSCGERKLDIGFMSNRESPSTLHWSQVHIPGELKSNRAADTRAQAWLDIARYAREVLAAQDSRRFVLAFTLCGSLMRVWIFDRLWGFASEQCDINTDPQRFVSTILALPRLSEEDIGFDPTVITEGTQRYMVIERNGRTERIFISSAIRRERCIAGRATTCWQAYSDLDPTTPLVVKDSWQYTERPQEGEMVREATEKGVVHVARYYFHTTVRVNNKDDDVSTNVRRGLVSPRLGRANTRLPTAGASQSRSGKGHCSPHAQHARNESSQSSES